jgi:hypothetical protein
MFISFLYKSIVLKINHKIHNTAVRTCRQASNLKSRNRSEFLRYPMSLLVMKSEESRSAEYLNKASDDGKGNWTYNVSMCKCKYFEKL